MIYLDNAATTRPAPEVVEAMIPYLREQYGNPSAIYSLGSSAKKAVNQAKRAIAGLINGKPEEIYFTSGGTESDNWALKSVAEIYSSKGRHIITTKIEHHAILHTCEYLEQKGFQVTYLDVDENGLVDPEEVEKSIRPDTILISVMFANNEIGTIEPVAEIGAIAKKHRVLFHTDAVQAFGQIPIDVDSMHIDLLSASAHKCNGPKGVGFLYIRSGITVPSFLHGGAQERRHRAGTENVPAIAGFHAAVLLAKERMDEKSRQETALRDHLIQRIEEEIPYCKLNGHRELRLPGNVNFTFRFVESESVVLLLDREGVCASGGSACTTGETDPSHVLMAIGCSEEEAKGSLRLSLSEDNTMEEMVVTVQKLKSVLEKLRSTSREYEIFCRKNGR